AIVHLLHQIIATGKRHHIPVSVCGELAGDPLFTPMLLALGLTEFSLHPSTLLEVRERIRAAHLGKLRRRASSLLSARDRPTLERWLARC
ncbi:MAG: phosphoenolpyruvate--protein phosphotransferase, partial [Gammaproteobacteria bacterium HGW-Gammaproteobacteria-5]